ncbi:hypothetical protein SCA6_001815 [Theobroma cacao]
MEENNLRGEEYKEAGRKGYEAGGDYDGLGRLGVSETNMIKLEDTPPEAVAATLKASDQMTGQTFNDVGKSFRGLVPSVGVLKLGFCAVVE